MVTWELIAMMLIPFVMFGVFAAVGVLLVKTSKEVGLRVIGYAVAVVFGVVALGMPVVQFITAPTDVCYDSRGESALFGRIGLHRQSRGTKDKCTHSPSTYVRQSGML